MGLPLVSITSVRGKPTIRMYLDDSPYRTVDLVETPKEIVDWAVGIIQQVEKLFGVQDDWAEDLLKVIEARKSTIPF